MRTIEDLLAQTIERHMHPEAHIEDSRYTALREDEQGYSGARLARYLIIFRMPDGTLEQTTLITKEASLVERRVLSRLQAQGQGVPFSHTLDLTTEEPALVCQQDVGAAAAHPVHAMVLQRAVARCLARIHYTNLGQAAALRWLPQANRTYFADFILADFHEQLSRAKNQPAFTTHCGDLAQQMEGAIEPFLTAMDALWADRSSCTLIHADMMDTHVLVKEGQPYLIDWGQARYGSLYLDLPNYFTPTTVQFYYEALAELGLVIPHAVFMERYHAAGRYPGFKYMGFLLHLWAAGHLHSLEGPLLQQLLHGAIPPSLPAPDGS